MTRKAANRCKIGGALVVAVQAAIDRRDISIRRIESSLNTNRRRYQRTRFTWKPPSADTRRPPSATGKT